MTGGDVTLAVPTAVSRHAELRQGLLFEVLTAMKVFFRGVSFRAEE
jgi:hypothetical protein